MDIVEERQLRDGASGTCDAPGTVNLARRFSPPRSGLWLTTEHWLLMTATPAHAPLLAQMHERNAEHFRLAMNLDSRMSEAAFWQPVLGNLQTSYEKGAGVHLVGFHRHAAGTEIGCVIDFSGIVYHEFQACWLGFRLDRSLEGKGLMRAALEPVLAAFFDRYKLHRIMASHLPENVRSGRLLRHLGFGIEGYARDFMFINGRWCDNVLTALIAPGRPLP